MRKITDFIVDKRNFILILFIILSVISVFVAKKVNINYDMTKYLPSDSETRIGMNIMEKEFDADESSSLNLMFKGLSNDDKTRIYEELKDINEVSEVNYEKESSDYNKDDYTLYVLDVDYADDSSEAKALYNNIEETYEDYEHYTSGSIASRNVTILPTWIIVLAVSICLFILIFMCESYIEPFLFLLCIGIAVLLNNGTNIIFDSVSNITSAISAILQLALSMDYSIMLMNRYRQEKDSNGDKVSAMKEALHKSFSSISSSSITTIVGLVSLVFMSFAIGRDLGLVLAKGVLLSLLSIFTCLPGLILMNDKLIAKTKKKVLNFNLKLLGNFSYRFRKPSIVVLLVVFIGSYFLKGNLKTLYTASENDEINNVFPENNQIAVIYNNKDEERIASCLDEFENFEKVDKVLAYGNTINEKITYDKFNEKLDELEADTDVEEYLLKIIYYKYYNDDVQNRMTFNEFVSFIKNDVLTNENFADKLSDDTEKSIDQLNDFVTAENINKKRTYKEIANILGINENDIYNLFVYYYSDKVNVSLTLNEFVSFLNKDVLTNASYASSVPESAKSSLNTLNKFLNKNTITKSMDASEMANMFGIDKASVEQLYLYYYNIYGVDSKLSINEFANFVINNVLTDENYKDMFDESNIQSLKLLQKMSDKNNIETNMNSMELANFFGMDEESVKQLLLLQHTKVDNGTALTISELIDFMNYLKVNTHYLDNVDISAINKISVFAKNENNINFTKLNKAGLSYIFGNVSEGLVEQVYMGLGLPDDYLLSLQEFIDIIINNLSGSLDKAILNNLKLMKAVIDDSANPSRYTATQISNILNISTEQTYQVYALYSYTNGDTANWRQTPYELVKFILDNLSDERISGSLNGDTIGNLQKVYEIMRSSSNVYSYKEIANVIGIDSSLTKSLYTLYASKTTEFKLAPNTFAKFMLEHKNDEALKGKIKGSTISQLSLVNNVMDSVISNKKFEAKEISSLFGLNEADVKLLYSLYAAKYVNSNMNASLNEFVDFILSKVITDPKYSSNFDDESTKNLNTINGIMKGTLNNSSYLAPEIYGIISNLTDSIDQNTIEVLYLYYGSEKNFQSEWTLTVEQFINYVYNNILQDSKFEDFIDDEMRNQVSDSKEMISDSKKLLVGDNYSRVIINTKYAPEADDTFDFIQSICDNIEGTECYVIGDSPMAYEMSKTFMQEFDYISIITMIAIFLVVAITFKSIIIPLILVLIIQCSVYTTMGILGALGGSVYYIALLIVQSILMGATIDYAIVYTSYYVELRRELEIREAIINSYNKSIHTILTSSLILISATFLVGQFSSGIISKICMTLSQGVLCATILILFILPAVLALFDKIIIKNKK